MIEHIFSVLQYLVLYNCLCGLSLLQVWYRNNWSSSLNRYRYKDESLPTTIRLICLFVPLVWYRLWETGDVCEARQIGWSMSIQMTQTFEHFSDSRWKLLACSPVRDGCTIATPTATNKLKLDRILSKGNRAAPHKLQVVCKSSLLGLHWVKHLRRDKSQSKYLTSFLLTVEPCAHFLALVGLGAYQA